MNTPSTFSLPMRSLSLVAVLWASIACASGQCAPNSLAVVVSKTNATDSLSTAQLRKLMLGDVHQWPDRKAVTLVDSTDVYKCLLSAVVRMTDAELRRYLANTEFRGDDPVPTKWVDSSAIAARAVASSQGGVALVDANAAAALGDAVKIVRINGKKPGEAGYPL